MSIFEQQSMLRVQSHSLNRPCYPAIDVHTHFGKLLGAMLSQPNNYLQLYDTKTVVAEMQEHGIVRAVNLDGGWGDEYTRVMEKLSVAGDFLIHFGQVDVERFESPSFETMVYNTIKTHKANGVKGLKFWKVIGLGIRDRQGAYLRPDDRRLQCIWQTAAEFDMPVLFHIGDLTSFFQKADSANEYVDTFRDHPEWLFTQPGLHSFQELMAMQENLLEANPKTDFIIAHVGSYAENLNQVGKWLDRFPNMYVDIADRLNELGRQPYTSRQFFMDYADRILFGTDLLPMDTQRYPIYYRFLETKDEYFPYRTEKGVMLGDWNIYGISLDGDVLRKVYHDNAAKVLRLL